MCLWCQAEVRIVCVCVCVCVCAVSGGSEDEGVCAVSGGSEQDFVCVSVQCQVEVIERLCVCGVRRK